MDEGYVDLGNARLEEQRRVMQQIVADGGCPFCPENLERYHRLPILFEGRFWRVTENQWPYEYTQYQLLAIYRQHVTRLTELDSESGQELLEVMGWFEKHNNIPGGALAMRFGDTRHSAGSVTHLHAQLIVPNLNHPAYRPVRLKIGSDR